MKFLTSISCTLFCWRHAGIRRRSTTARGNCGNTTIQNCIVDVLQTAWCGAQRLQLNPSKTEVLWFGTTAIQCIPSSERNVVVGTNTITPADSVRHLGVQFDSEMSIRAHIAKTCFLHLRRLRQIRVSHTPSGGLILPTFAQHPPASYLDNPLISRRGC